MLTTIRKLAIQGLQHACASYSLAECVRSLLLQDSRMELTDVDDALLRWARLAMMM